MGSGHLVQTSQATGPTLTRYLQTTDVALLHTIKNFSSIVYMEMNPDLFVMSLPFRLADEFKFNGQNIGANKLFVDDAQTHVTHGGAREMMSVAMNKTRLVLDIAALQGVDPDDARLSFGELNLPDIAVARLGQRLLHAIDLFANDPGLVTDTKRVSYIQDEIYNLIADYLLCAQDGKMPEYGTRRTPIQIFKAAEDAFEAANGAPISIADLCRAANVSAGTLTHTFRSLTDMTPARYFKMRRINKAHELLSHNAFDRSPVKQAALNSGLTDLGRFSVEYKMLFGNSPSDT